MNKKPVLVLPFNQDLSLIILRMFDKNGGISATGDLLDVAINTGIIEKAGAFLKYKGKLLAQGREAARKLLGQKQELFDEIKAAVIANGPAHAAAPVE